MNSPIVFASLPSIGSASKGEVFFEGTPELFCFGYQINFPFRYNCGLFGPVEILVLRIQYLVEIMYVYDEKQLLYI